MAVCSNESEVVLEALVREIQVESRYLGASGRGTPQSVQEQE